MRQGSVQPFKVTTGLYGRPLGGARGGWVDALSIAGASGSDAAPARLTSPAPRATAPAFKKNFRRVTKVHLLPFIYWPIGDDAEGLDLPFVALSIELRMRDVFVESPV